MDELGFASILDEFPDYRQAVMDYLAAGGISPDHLRRLPAEAATSCIDFACCAVLTHELCEDDCPDRALHLAEKLLSKRDEVRRYT